MILQSIAKSTGSTKMLLLDSEKLMNHHQEHVASTQQLSTFLTDSE